ncbi:L-histidine N(alpha)-methyltransferase [Ideonella azotifigens]|uniref:L-histidine N(Alpha)-methyltransferase n=1 Tax=Ideonella azotifigens TaxID=513160 RepID=A0ABN1JVR3_9BURK|nr:L-histidine N(alpha)-methyltransferase [Ideonella azotifigens]MCD2343245.1 L-histidine N(alpha)-methyltransferase [Ideonella azotifigens]
MRAVFDSIPTLRDVVSRTQPRGLTPVDAAPEDPERAAIVAALLKPAASISPKYFYDEQGSALFEAITEVPEYYVTRTERAVMVRHHESIASAVGECSSIIELGAGSCKKAMSLCELLDPDHLVVVDISGDFLATHARVLQAGLPWMQVHQVVADITRPFELPPALPMQRRLVFYPGSSIGNFEPAEACALLARARGLSGDDGALLLGVDLVKDPQILQAAYDDHGGVTAAFNRNVLTHLNTLIGSDFQPAQWRHVALFNAQRSRVEMHLEASRELEVRWAGGGRRFAAGERIHTENSYKYTPDRLQDLLATAGYSRVRCWTDARGWFAVVLAQP